MNPVLKYRGGKSREIPRFLQYIPDDFNRYIEPFFGGGAVYFYLEPENAIINDVNTRLMIFYRQLRDNYPEMRAQLDTLQQLYEENQARYKRLKAQTPDERVPNDNEALYYRIRELFNHPDGTYNEILSDEVYDAPLFLEWNTWRAMTMLDGGTIKGNFNSLKTASPTTKKVIGASGRTTLSLVAQPLKASHR